MVLIISVSLDHLKSHAARPLAGVSDDDRQWVIVGREDVERQFALPAYQNQKRALKPMRSSRPGSREPTTPA